MPERLFLSVFLFTALCAASPTTHAALISEFLYDAVGSDNGFGFVELAGVPGASLDGWTLVVINGTNGAVATTIPLGGAIPDDRVFVVADGDSTGATEVANADRIENFDIQNGPDSLQLLDASGSVLDAVGFGDFGAGEVFAGEGSPAPDAPAGASLRRGFADLDTDDNAADFAVEVEPSPGLARFQGTAPPPGALVPEPSTALLCGIGLLWMGARRRV